MATKVPANLDFHVVQAHFHFFYFSKSQKGIHSYFCCILALLHRYGYIESPYPIPIKPNSLSCTSNFVRSSLFSFSITNLSFLSFQFFQPSEVFILLIVVLLHCLILVVVAQQFLFLNPTHSHDRTMMPQSSPLSLSLLLPYRKKVWILLITSLLCCLIDACGFCSIYNLDYSKRELITLLSKHNPRISSLAGTLNFASFHKVSHYNHVWLQNKRAIIHFGLFDHLDK